MKLFLTCLIFGITPLVFAQDFMGFLMPSTSPTQVELKGSALPDSHANASNRSTSMHSSSISANHKIFNQGKRLITVGGKWDRLALRPDDEYVKDYHNVQGTIGYREELSGDRFQFFSLGYGSASDQPFKNGRDSTLNANYIRKFNSKWYGIANFSNNRSFLNNIPIPGFIYVQELTRERFLLYGFPFVLWGRPLSENFSFQLLALIPWTYRLKVSYVKYKWILPYAVIEQSPESFFRHDREQRYDRFFWFERRVGLGAEAFLSKNTRVDLSAGYAFDREFSESEDFGIKSKFKTRVQNNAYISTTIRLSL